jgi:hypothetical protein
MTLVEFCLSMFLFVPGYVPGDQELTMRLHMASCQAQIRQQSPLMNPAVCTMLFPQQLGLTGRSDTRSKVVIAHLGKHGSKCSQ